MFAKDRNFCCYIFWSQNVQGMELSGVLDLPRFCGTVTVVF